MHSRCGTNYTDVKVGWVKRALYRREIYHCTKLLIRNLRDGVAKDGVPLVSAPDPKCITAAEGTSFYVTGHAQLIAKLEFNFFNVTGRLKIKKYDARG